MRVDLVARTRVLVARIRVLGSTSGDSGIVLIEMVLAIGLILMPVVGVCGAAVVWPGRLNAAHSAAYEAAKAMVSSDGDEGLAQDRAAAVWANHGYDAEDISVAFSGDPEARGGELKATVTITLPAIPLPGVGSHASASWSTSHIERVPDYRGFG